MQAGGLSDHAVLKAKYTNHFDCLGLNAVGNRVTVLTGQHVTKVLELAGRPISGNCLNILMLVRTSAVIRVESP
jgi:hypothetical protein